MGSNPESDAVYCQAFNLIYFIWLAECDVKPQQQLTSFDNE